MVDACFRGGSCLKSRQIVQKRPKMVHLMCLFRTFIFLLFALIEFYSVIYSRLFERTRYR